MNYGSSTSSRKLWTWVRLDLIFLMRDICINSNPNPLKKFTRSSKSTEFKDILPWNISPMIMKTIPISTRILISYAMKRGILFWINSKINGNWDNMVRISKWRESHCRTNTSTRRIKEIQKCWTERITAWDTSRKVNHLSKVIWDKKYNRVHQIYQYSRIGKPVLMMDIKVCNGKHICRWVIRENLIYIRWNRIKNCTQRQRRWSIEKNEVRHWVK